MYATSCWHPCFPIRNLLSLFSPSRKGVNYPNLCPSQCWCILVVFFHSSWHFPGYCYDELFLLKPGNSGYYVMRVQIFFETFCYRWCSQNWASRFLTRPSLTPKGQSLLIAAGGSSQELNRCQTNGDIIEGRGLITIRQCASTTLQWTPLAPCSREREVYFITLLPSQRRSLVSDSPPDLLWFHWGIGSLITPYLALSDTSPGGDGVPHYSLTRINI